MEHVCIVFEIGPSPPLHLFLVVFMMRVPHDDGRRLRCCALGEVSYRKCLPMACDVSRGDIRVGTVPYVVAPCFLEVGAD